MLRNSMRKRRGVVRSISLALSCTLWSALLWSPAVQATLIGASSAPKRAHIPVEEGRTLQIRWVISTTSAHNTGAFSAQGVLKDTATSTVLKTLATPFNQAEGAGPLHFNEALTITAEEAGEWLKLGYRQLEFTRQFSTGSERPSTSEAKVIIQLGNKDMDNTYPGPQTALTLHNLELSYKPQRFRSSISAGLPLQAQLNLAYSGSGELKGSWQLASADANGQMRYRELALVNKELRPGGRDWLLSPQLPTGSSGQYILRFCKLDNLNSTNAGGEAQCPAPQLSASLEYHVIEGKPLDQAQSAPATLSADTLLSWPAVNDTLVYELSLYQHSDKDSITSAEFVGRLLLTSQTIRTTLSPELLEQLKPGATYDWQVKALDRHGDLIQQTTPARFVFMP